MRVVSAYTFMNANFQPPKENDSFFHEVFDETSEYLWILNPDGTVYYVNRTALEAIGASYAEIIGKSLWETPWWSDSDETRSLIREAVDGASSDVIHHEVQCVTGSNCFAWIELSIKPIFQSDGQPRYLLAEGRDITLRKETLERLRERETLLVEAQSLGQLGSWTWDAATNAITWTEGLYRVFGFEDDAQPRTAEDYGPRTHPDDREAMNSALLPVMETDLPIHYSHRVIRPDGEIRYVHGVARRVTDDVQKVVRVYGMIQDITAQQLIEQQLTRSIRQREMVSDLAQTVAATLDKRQIYERVASILRPLIEADAVAIFERDGEYLAIQRADAATEEQAEKLAGVRVPIVNTVAGEVWESGHSVLRHASDFDHLVHANVREALGYMPRSIISVPMHWQGERLGVVQAYHTTVTAFDDEDRQLLDIVAVWLAIALINARLLETQRAARREAERQSERLQVLTRRILSAQEDERRRIARELHDEAGQALAVLKMNLSLLRNDIHDPVLKTRVAEILDLTGQTAKNVRLLAHNLRPPSLDAFGLVHTLEELCRKFANHTQLQLDFHADPLPPLSTDFNIVCYRFVQEALANVAKHANATEINVSIQNIGNTLVIEVRDNGEGFDVNKARSGIGFLGMTERLELLDGILEVESQRGQGARVVARVPMHTIEAAPAEPSA